MGLILKSFTSPRSWYMCSRQLSILKYKTLMIVSSVLLHVSHFHLVLITHCVHWYINFSRTLTLCIFHLADHHLVRFPLPHIEEWLPQSFYGLLWEVVLHTQKREEEEDRTVALHSYLVWLPQPDVEGGFSEGIYGLLGEHVLQVTELSVNPR